MIIDPQSARLEWADRVTLQSQQLRIIARATDDVGMREELLGYAQRLREQAGWIRAQAA